MAFGEFAGFWVAWGYWLSVCAANAALAVAFVGYLDPFVPAIVHTPLLAASAAVGVVWLLTAVNVRGIDAAARVQLVTTALKIIPLLVIGIAGIAWFQPSHFTMTPATGGLAKSVVTTATLTLWAFLGLECATIPAHHTAQADRTIPRATIVGTLITAAIYILSTVGVMSLLEPATLARSTAPFADAALVLAGRSASELVALGAAISCFGALNGWVLIAGQIQWRSPTTVCSRDSSAGSLAAAHRLRRCHLGGDVLGADRDELLAIARQLFRSSSCWPRSARWCHTCSARLPCSYCTHATGFRRRHRRQWRTLRSSIHSSRSEAPARRRLLGFLLLIPGYL
jgi:hypothetical protein